MPNRIRKQQTQTNKDDDDDDDDDDLPQWGWIVRYLIPPMQSKNTLKAGYLVVYHTNRNSPPSGVAGGEDRKAVPAC